MEECSSSLNGVFFAAFFSVFFSLAAAADTIAAGQSINQTESLVSAEGWFRLGFFSSGKSRRRYLGIWYDQMTPQTVVWVANRWSPLPESSLGFLTLAENGTLLLTDGRGVVYWSTAVSTEEVRGPVARLMNSGNLVVDGQGRHVWQSFDHPGDTMLPGMKLGYDFGTGLSPYFTSWRTAEDPAPGDFTLAFDARGAPQVFFLNGTTPLWRPGPWVGRHFTGVPDMNAYNRFIYSYVDNSGGVSFKFDVWDSSMITRIVLQPWGTMEHFVWSNATSRWDSIWKAPRDTCDGYNRCGHNGVCNGTSPAATCGCLPGFVPRWPLEWEKGITGGGCVRQVELECLRGKGSFSMLTRAKLPDTSGAAMALGVGLEACMAACLRNCSCTAFSSSDGSGCITWFGDLVDIRVFEPPDTKVYLIIDAGQDLYVRQPGSTRKKEVIVVITVSTTVALLLLVMGVSRRQILAMQFFRKEYDQDSQKDIELRAFRFSKISSATNSFSPANKIGLGGFGTVYKGELDGENVAVKRLSRHSVQGLEEFKSETQLVAKLQHMNLVKLLGYCTESEEKILVYEYMPNQSLDKFIFDPEQGRLLDWKMRFQIINGIAQGLVYLHRYSRLRVIHRDLKASNILLDGEWNPKISDFGLAKIFTAWNNSQANTNRIVGTHGYMSPEYVIKGLFSVKSDVFSFGVLLLEILSGKKNTRCSEFGNSLNLPGYVCCGGQIWSPRPMMARYGLFQSCQPTPTMFDVVSMLNNEFMGLQEPNPPAFFIGRNVSSDGHLQTLVCSNDVTISALIAMRTLPAAALCVAAFLSAIAHASATEGDSLAAGQFIKHNESLVSGQGSFRLGFFTSRPNHTYLGVWYNRITVRTVVWVANRLRPLPDSTAGSLLLSQNGALVVADSAGAIYWSADTTANLSNPVARLLENGNLVIHGDGGVSYAWESFAEPTDTMLPGMKVGVNRRTGESSNLTAWKSTDDPSPGDYSWLVLVRGVPQLFVVNGTVPQWRGGPWAEERFTGVPDMKSNDLFSYGFTANSDDLFLKFDQWKTSMATRITLYPSGIAKHLMWDYGRGTWESIWETVNDTCDRVDYCGPNAVCQVKTPGPVCSCLEGFHFQTPQQQEQAGRRGAATGSAAVCKRNRPLACPGGKDAFVLVSGAKLPDTSLATSWKVGFDECRAACLGNCSCTAFSSGADGSGCITWFGNLTDLRLYNGLGQDLYVRVASEVGLLNPQKVDVAIEWSEEMEGGSAIAVIEPTSLRA
ncbi:hypothetical protein Taro_050095 [Colocasia esculenta]|uniref:non-specific serine/threonine protein kinase n=1 Tax=Colocasia esculenta TaxID=4460 RepID=A0A843XCI7_COLES|nr:hypothetical protein [Colocasia esculenta]